MGLAAVECLPTWAAPPRGLDLDQTVSSVYGAPHRREPCCLKLGDAIAAAVSVPSAQANIRVAEREAKMKLSIPLSALLIAGSMVASSEPASAVVYCQYISYPAGCVVRPGVRLVARPFARAVVTPGVGAAGVGVRAGTPMNRGGPVNRVGRR